MQPPSLPVVSNDQNQQRQTPTFTGVSTGQRGHHHMNHHHGHQQPWSTGLCDCCEDPKICCLTWCCPCITFGRIAEIVDRGSTSCGVSGSLYVLLLWVFGCSCMYSCMYRSKMRGQFFLEEKPCNDCCVHCWCESCSLCQEYRELQNRGFNLSIGWHGNVERHRRMEQMHPVVPNGMHR